ncbi:unnamed protein product [Cochlearia groenlandica]
MDSETIKFKLPKPPLDKSRRKNQTNTNKKKMEEEKGFIRTRMGFQVKKINSAISGVFSRKKPLPSGNRGQRANSEEKVAEADESLLVGKVKPKQNPLHKKRFWERARTRLKILILGQRLKKTTRIRKCLSESPGEDELCKKRILMGERCIPINKSGVLQYDDDGILLPEP